MFDSPAVALVRILHEHQLGTIKELKAKIDNLPAEFGPIQDRAQAEQLVELLQTKGVEAHVREDIRED